MAEMVEIVTSWFMGARRQIWSKSHYFWKYLCGGYSLFYT
jgi:hypothetical protein